MKGLILFLLRAKYYKSRDEKRIAPASEVESGLTIHHAAPLSRASYGQHCVEPSRIKEAVYESAAPFFRESSHRCEFFQRKQLKCFTRITGGLVCLLFINGRRGHYHASE